MKEDYAMGSTRAMTGWALLAIIGSGFILRIPSTFRPVWNLDEAASACIADVILNGGLPFKDAIDTRPPLTYYAFAMVFAIFGRNNMPAVHLSLSLLVGVIALVIYALGSLVCNRRAALLATLAFAVLSFSFFAPMDMCAA